MEKFIPVVVIKELEEVTNYYFTKKVFKAIEAFSKKLTLEYRILMDNKVWNL